MTDWTGRLGEFARRPPRIVCLPDFYVDHFVELPSLEETLSRIRRVHARRGGGWVGIRQRYLPGGNAGNAAQALAALGARVHLIARTDPFGRAFAEATLGARGVDLRRLRADGPLGTTTALEFHPGPVNVMFNQPGSVADFGPRDLLPADRRLIESADAVLVGNWAQALRHGTSLAATVLRWAKRAGTLTFLDTSDPSDRPQDIPELVQKVLTSNDLHVLGLNEVEMRHYGGPGDPLKAGKRFQARIHATLDLHTQDYAASWGPKGHAVAPAYVVECMRVTGAGDAWNAGDLVGHLLDLEPAERLQLANAVAALYVSGPDGRPPKLASVARFLRRRPRTRRPR